MEPTYQAPYHAAELLGSRIDSIAAADWTGIVKDNQTFQHAELLGYYSCVIALEVFKASKSYTMCNREWQKPSS